VHERPHRGLLREICGLLRRTPSGAEQAAKTIERLRVGVVEFDGQFGFEVPSFDGQGRLTPKPF
jgi:hypothetical protein